MAEVKLDRIRIYSWAEAVQFAYNPNPGFEFIGWLWQPNSGSWRWTFTTNLTGRSYAVTARFIPVYAETRTYAPG